MSLQFNLFLVNFPAMGKKYRNQDLINRIAAELTSIRDSASLTQEDVYNDTGIHIARIETGAINISISTLDELLKYYKIDFISFFSNLTPL